MQRCCTRARHAALRRGTFVLPASRQRARGETDRVVRGAGSQRGPGGVLRHDSPPAILAARQFVRNPEQVMSDPVVKPSRHHIWRITKRAFSKSWDDSIFSESAQAAFWSALSLPPLLLGMLGSLAYVAPLFGPDTMSAIEQRLVSMSNKIFSPSVVHEIIEPTIADIDRGARGEVVSLGFCDFAVGGIVGNLCVRRFGGRGPRSDPAAASGAPAAVRVAAVRGDAALRHRHCPADGARAAQARRIHSRRLAGCVGLRLLPGVAHRPDRHRGRSCIGWPCRNRCRRTG